ncbi:Pre-glycoprotein polyprotein GP complex, partial [Bienertia sinuspersici]
MVLQMSSGSESSSRTRSMFPHQKCYCNEIAPLRMQTCGFFKWADGSDDIRELQELVYEKDTIIAEQEMHNEMLAKKLKEVQGKM